MFFVVKSLKRHLEVLLVLPLSSRVSLGSAARARRTRPAGRVCAEQGLRMQVEPREYGPNLRETVQTKLREAVENTCSERYGYILKIFNVDTERLHARTGDPSALARTTATRKLIDPDEVARLVAFLCTPENGSLTGATIELTAGSHLAVHPV